METKLLELKIIGVFFVILYTWLFFFRLKKFFPWKIFDTKIIRKWYLYSVISISMYSIFFLPLSKKDLNIVIGMLLFSLFGIFNLAVIAKKMSIQSAEYFKNEGDIEKATKFNNLAKRINNKIKEGLIIIIILIALIIKKNFFDK